MARKSISRIGLVTLYLRLIAKGVCMALGMARKISPIIAAMRRLLKTACEYTGFWPTLCTKRIDGRSYWHLYVPGFPSAAFDRVFRHWLAYHLGLDAAYGLYTGLMSVTRKCGLFCEHCYEWEWLNLPEEPEEIEVFQTVEKLMALGPGQIILGGGEPASRVSTILRILERFSGKEVQFWISTSGMGLDRQKLGRLKQGGLTGIVFSLDHFDESAHDRFRGRHGCYRHALSMLDAANELRLVTALSLCATNGFVSLENLAAYMQLASALDVSFVQVLEPKPVGRYKGRRVSLTPEKVAVLESFVRRAKKCPGWPRICYPDYAGRRYGCSGGKLYLYIDTAGQAFPCPFCRTEPAALAGLTPSNMEKMLSCPRGADCNSKAGTEFRDCEIESKRVTVTRAVSVEKDLCTSLTHSGVCGRIQ